MAVEKAVDDYLDSCQKLGHKLNKPVFDNLVLRVSDDIETAIEKAAMINGKTIN